MNRLRLLLPYLRPYRGRYVFGAFCIAASILGKLLIPQVLGGSIDRLRTDAEAGVASGRDSGLLLDELVSGALIITGLAIAIALIRTASRLSILGGSRRVVHDVRRNLFDHLLKLPPSFFARHSTGKLMSRCVNDVQNVQGLTGPVFMYLSEVATLYAISLVFMFDIDVGLTLLALLPFPFFLYFARKQARKIQTGSRAAQEGLGRISARVDESLSGQLIIKALALEEFDHARFAKECAEYKRLNLEVTWARATLMPLMMGLGALTTLVVLAVGGPKVVANELSLGDFVAMVFYLQFLAAPTGVLGFVLSSLQRGTAALVRIHEVIETPSTLVDPATPVEGAVPAGALAVRDLSVTLPRLDAPPPLRDEGDDEQPTLPREVLRNISFDIPAGSILGIVGHTGSGKSILANALSRLLEVDEGQIFYDGVDVTQMRLADVRRRIAYVPQEAFLFGMPLVENIAYGNPDASREQVQEAIEAACLTQDLPQLYEGLDTRVGERGVMLSGGQRQRAALARALLLDPQVVVLDDTLSAVDAHTAEKILAHLEPWAADRTTILVAHRLATVAHADLILVLEEGRIVERGTHAELLAANGQYASLWQRQQLEADLESNGDAE